MEPLQSSDPERIGRYRLIGRLGTGGMGRVYLGETPEGAQAAIKVIRDDLADDTAFRARFRREVWAAVSVAGLFTARVVDADPDGDPPWLATQYVSGPSLRAAVERDGPFPADGLVALAQGLADALGSIHAAGLVHRDLKPSNVLLSPDGPRVIDFGIAKAAAATQLTATGAMIGTPDYMSPEQVAGPDAGQPSDVFALGSTLVFAATGSAPFAADQTAATLYRIVSTEPDLGAVPGAVRAIVRSCLTKDPAERPTAQQLAVQLRSGLLTADDTLTGEQARPVLRPPLVPAAVSGAETITPAPARARDPDPVARARRRRWPLLVAAIGTVVVLAGAVVVLTRYPAALTPTPTVITTTSPAVTATVDQNDPRAVYVDRFCRSATLLTIIGGELTDLRPDSDLTVGRQDLLSATGRSIGLVDTALPDLGLLRDDAPDSATKLAYAQIVTEFTNARTAFSDAQDRADAADPLPAPVYTAALARFDDGERNLSLGVTIQQGIALPAEYQAARAGNPRCR